MCESCLKGTVVKCFCGTEFRSFPESNGDRQQICQSCYDKKLKDDAWFEENKTDGEGQDDDDSETAATMLVDLKMRVESIEDDLKWVMDEVGSKVTSTYQGAMHERMQAAEDRVEALYLALKFKWIPEEKTLVKE